MHKKVYRFPGFCLCSFQSYRPYRPMGSFVVMVFRGVSGARRVANQNDPIIWLIFLTKKWDHCYHIVHLSRLCIPFRSFPFLHLSKEGNAGTLPPSGEFLLRARNNCSFGHLGWSSFWRKGKEAGGTDFLDISSSYLFFTLKFEVTLFKNV